MEESSLQGDGDGGQKHQHNGQGLPEAVELGVGEDGVSARKQREG